MVESVSLMIFIYPFQRFVGRCVLYRWRHNKKFKRNQENLTSQLNFEQSFAEKRYLTSDKKYEKFEISTKIGEIKI